MGFKRNYCTREICYPEEEESKIKPNHLLPQPLLGNISILIRLLRTQGTRSCRQGSVTFIILKGKLSPSQVLPPPAQSPRDTAPHQGPGLAQAAPWCFTTAVRSCEVKSQSGAGTRQTSKPGAVATLGNSGRGGLAASLTQPRSLGSSSSL